MTGGERKPRAKGGAAKKTACVRQTDLKVYSAGGASGAAPVAEAGAAAGAAPEAAAAPAAGGGAPAASGAAPAASGAAPAAAAGGAQDPAPAGREPPSAGEAPRPATTRSGVVSENVVMHLRVDPGDELDRDRILNYETEYLNYRPVVPTPSGYAEDDTFTARPGKAPPRPHETDAPGNAGEPKGVRGEARPPPGEEGPVPVPALQGWDEEQGGSPGSSEDGGETARGGPADPACAKATPLFCYSKRIVTVLRDVEQRNKAGSWPLGTSAACYWCCHSFQGPPLGLPVRCFSEADREAPPGARGAGPAWKEPRPPGGQAGGGGFYCTGNFCSISCAAAFNFDSRESTDTVCERHSMLSCLHRKLLSGGRAGRESNGEGGAVPMEDMTVRAAPPRTVLQMFGGHMTVSEFRAHSQGASSVFLENTFPLRCLTQQLEEVDEADVGGRFTFVPIDQDSVDRGMKELTLRREKSLVGGKGSLDLVQLAAGKAPAPEGPPRPSPLVFSSSA